MRAKVSEAIGLAMQDMGVDIATYVPGLGATEVYYDYCTTSGQKPIISFHEEVAYTIAHGAALAGKRAFKSVRGPTVTGDTGMSTLFALPPYNCIDVTTYMGGSVPLAIGAYLAGCKPAWAVTGDFALVAAGHLGLLEAAQRNIPLKVLVLYNGKSETTGGQRIPDGTLERVIKGYEEYVSYIHDPQNSDELKDVLGSAAHADELSLIIADFR